MQYSRSAKVFASVFGTIVAVVFCLLLIPLVMPADQPTITWSIPTLEAGLSQGQSQTGTVTFNSNQLLENVTIEAVPAVAPFVKIEPGVIPEVPAGKSLSVVVTFTIASSTPIGSYDGTIHVRVGKETIPQTLKVVLHVANPLGIGFAELVNRNQLIVLGNVRSVQSAFDPSGASIFSTVTLFVTRVLKGSLPPGVLALSIQLRGGTVGQISSVVPGSPSFTSGESVVVFLGGPDSSGRYSIPDDALGTFHVFTDSTSGQIAVVDQAYLQGETLEGRTPDFQHLIAQSSQHQLSYAELLSALGVSP